MLLPFREEFIGDWMRPAIHGGVISALIDATGGGAAWADLNPGDRLATVDIVVDYLRPAGPADLQADARVVRIGNRVALVEVDVHHPGKQEILARGRAVYNVVRQRHQENR